MLGCCRTEFICLFICSFRNISQAHKRWQEMCQAQRWVMSHTSPEPVTHSSGYFPKVIVWHLVPPFLAFISFPCNGVPPLGRRGGAATNGSVFEQRTTKWNNDPGKARETILSSAIWLGTVLATSKSPEKKINYMNN